MPVEDVDLQNKQIDVDYDNFDMKITLSITLNRPFTFLPGFLRQGTHKFRSVIVCVARVPFKCIRAVINN